MYHGFYKILCSTTVFNIDNNHKYTEDWSNDAENHRNKLQFNTYSHRKQLF